MYNPEKHHRRSIRLPGYDYSRSGLYYVTICVQEKLYLFGSVVNDKMILNEAGRCIEKVWNELPNRFPMVQLNAFVVMPNHVHGIIRINVGAGLCARPDNKANGRPRRVAPTLGNIMGWFKTITTNKYIQGVKQYGWPPFPGKLWQRNYFEHIIRDGIEWGNIYKYIEANPMNWTIDVDNNNNQYTEIENPWLK